MTVWNFQGAVVPVTGAASGIGFTLCTLLRAAGAKPIMLDRDGDRLKEAVAQVYAGESDPQRFGDVVDVTDSAAIDRCFAAIEQDHGTVTHAVANAGITGQTHILDVEDADWHRIMGVNLHGVMYFSRAASRSMVKSKRGAIVLLSSIAGFRAKEGRIAYSASKGAVVNLTRALALDLGPSGIRVNSVAPGVTDTPQQLLNSPEYRQAHAARTALGRTAKPEEIANAILFLLSDFSSYVTGETLVVDGGVTLRFN